MPLPKSEQVIVPYFGRWSDFVGVWLIEPQAARALWQMTRNIDIGAHVRYSLSHQQKVELPLHFIPTRNDKRLGVVNLSGTMMKGESSLGGCSTIAARRAIRQATNDSQVSGLLLNFDTPGGSSAGTADLAADIRNARKTKPVYGQIEDMCASAGMWAASQCDQLYLNANTGLVGNVGTYLLLNDTSEKNAKEGVKEIAFSSGPPKVFGDGLGVSEQQSAYMQGIVDNVQREFIDAVKKGRGLSDSKVKEISSGAIYTGEDALRLKLVDGIQSMDRTIAKLANAA